jgi:hypothetical protein
MLAVRHDADAADTPPLRSSERSESRRSGRMILVSETGDRRHEISSWLEFLIGRHTDNISSGLSFAAAPSKRSPQYLTGLQERAQSQQVTRLLTRTVSRARADSGFRFVALMRPSEQFVPQTCSVDDSLNGGGYRLINPMFPKSTFDRECWATRTRVDRKARDLDNFDG